MLTECVDFMLLTGPQDLKENKIKAKSKSKVKFNSTEIKIWRKGSFDPFPVMNPNGCSAPG